MKSLLFFSTLGIVLFLRGAVADPVITDLEFDSIFRAQPLGMMNTLQFGQGVPIWGPVPSLVDRKNLDEVDWKYGYVRSAFIVESAAVVNRLGARFEVFPISIVGFGFSSIYSWRSLNNRYYDCEVLTCRGLIYRNNLYAKVGGKLGNFGAGFQVRLDFVYSSDRTRDFMDEQTLLTGHRLGDTFFSVQGGMLYDLDSLWSVGAYGQWGKMKINGGEQSAAMLFLRQQREGWNWFGGPGIFGATPIGVVPSFFLGLKWILKPSIGLL